MTQIAGLRLTYAELTGKVGETTQAQSFSETTRPEAEGCLAFDFLR